jgi:hypothetical protein
MAPECRRSKFQQPCQIREIAGIAGTGNLQRGDTPLSLSAAGFENEVEGCRRGTPHAGQAGPRQDFGQPGFACLGTQAAAAGLAA